MNSDTYINIWKILILIWKTLKKVGTHLGGAPGHTVSSSAFKLDFFREELNRNFELEKKKIKIRKWSFYRW